MQSKQRGKEVERGCGSGGGAHVVYDIPVITMTRRAEPRAAPRLLMIKASCDAYHSETLKAKEVEVNTAVRIMIIRIMWSSFFTGNKLLPPDNIW